MIKASQKVYLPYDVTVYASDLSKDITVAFYNKSEALKNGNEIFTVSLLKGCLVNLVVYLSSDGIGISENIEIETESIKNEKGSLVYG